MTFPVARQKKDYRPVSPFDGSKPTIPPLLAEGRGVVPAPRTASSASNPTLSTVKTG
jgi:hypothetical protein